MSRTIALPMTPPSRITAPPPHLSGEGFHVQVKTV